VARSNKHRKKRPPRKPIGRRVGEGLDAIGDFGKTAVERPHELPRHAEGILRRWFRNVWAVRGGGLYAAGFGVSFLYLEIIEIVTDDIPTLFTINILSSDLIEYVISFIIDTFMNFVTALIWPFFIATYSPPWGAIGLWLAFVAFNRFLKEPVERWLDIDADPDDVVDPADPDGR
jgi:hypothetical protein